jgi:hypothetical protein
MKDVFASNSKRHIKAILIVTIISISLFILFAFNAEFFVHVYDEQTREFVEMSYNDVTSIFSSQCIGTPGTGDSGFYLFESRFAFPGFVTVKVKGYESKTVFGFLGFKNTVNVYISRAS